MGGVKHGRGDQEEEEQIVPLDVAARRPLEPRAGALGGLQQADCPRDGEEVKKVTVVVPSRGFFRRERREDSA